MRPAMLVDIMWPLLSVLEGNRDAPMREAIGWELQLADSTDDADVRDAYADRLAEWGCEKREADVRRESQAIRAGGTVPVGRLNSVIGIRHPVGYTEVDKPDGGWIVRENSDIAKEILDGIYKGGCAVFENTPHPTMPGHFQWEFIFADGTSGRL